MEPFCRYPFQRFNDEHYTRNATLDEAELRVRLAASQEPPPPHEDGQAGYGQGRLRSTCRPLWKMSVVTCCCRCTLCAWWTAQDSEMHCDLSHYNTNLHRHAHNHKKKKQREKKQRHTRVKNETATLPVPVFAITGHSCNASKLQPYTKPLVRDNTVDVLHVRRFAHRA